MDRLKDFIEQHRDEFEQEPMPEGHWERFACKLDAQQAFHKKENPHRRRLYLYLSAAAAACIALLLCLSPDIRQNEPADPLALQAKAVHCEFGEVQFYYRMQMEAIVSEMEEINNRENSEASLHLLSESRKILQNNDCFAEKIAPSLPVSTEGLNTANLYYQCNLNSLKQMLQSLKQLHQTERTTKTYTIK